MGEKGDPKALPLAEELLATDGFGGGEFLGATSGRLLMLWRRTPHSCTGRQP